VKTTTTLLIAFLGMTSFAHGADECADMLAAYTQVAAQELIKRQSDCETTFAAICKGLHRWQAEQRNAGAPGSESVTIAYCFEACLGEHVATLYGTIFSPIKLFNHLQAQKAVYEAFLKEYKVFQAYSDQRIIKSIEFINNELRLMSDVLSSMEPSLEPLLKHYGSAVVFLG